LLPIIENNRESRKKSPLAKCNELFLKFSTYRNRIFVCRSSNTDNPPVFTAGNLSKIPDFLNVAEPVEIFFHGWLNSASTPGIMNITDLYSSRVSAQTLSFCGAIHGTDYKYNNVGEGKGKNFPVLI
jgi:hypothetical protein